MCGARSLSSNKARKIGVANGMEIRGQVFSILRKIQFVPKVGGKYVQSRQACAHRWNSKTPVWGKPLSEKNRESDLNCCHRVVVKWISNRFIYPKKQTLDEDRWGEWDGEGVRRTGFNSLSLQRFGAHNWPHRCRWRHRIHNRRPAASGMSLLGN